VLVFLTVNFSTVEKNADQNQVRNSFKKPKKLQNLRVLLTVKLQAISDTEATSIPVI